MTGRMTRAATASGPAVRANRNTVLTVAGHNVAVRRKRPSELRVDR
jgi:hypothetical protein